MVAQQIHQAIPAALRSALQHGRRLPAERIILAHDRIRYQDGLTSWIGFAQPVHTMSGTFFLPIIYRKLKDKKEQTCY
jgi:hypothetical protein